MDTNFLISFSLLKKLLVYSKQDMLFRKSMRLLDLTKT